MATFHVPASPTINPVVSSTNVARSAARSTAEDQRRGDGTDRRRRRRRNRPPSRKRRSTRNSPPPNKKSNPPRNTAKFRPRHDVVDGDALSKGKASHARFQNLGPLLGMFGETQVYSFVEPSRTE